MVYPGMSEDIENEVRLAATKGRNMNTSKFEKKEEGAPLHTEPGALWGDVRGVEATVRELVLQQQLDRVTKGTSGAGEASTLTALAMDRSFILETYVQEQCGGRWGIDGLLGEVQVSS